MNIIIEELFGNIEMSPDMKTMVILILFVFIISITVDIFAYLGKLGGGR